MSTMSEAETTEPGLPNATEAADTQAMSTASEADTQAMSSTTSEADQVESKEAGCGHKS